MKKLMLALVGAALATSPIFAQDGELPRKWVKVKVATPGPNPPDARDIARLQKRVDAAIAQACTPRGVYHAFQVADPDCANKMTSDSNTIIAGLTRDSKVRSAEF